MPDFLEQRFPVARRGVVDGIDPAAPEFPADGAADLENIRVGQYRWQTRLGMSLWDPDTDTGTPTFGATGAVQYLATFYRSDGVRYRLVSQAGAFKEMLSSGTAFAAVSGGGSLNTTPQNSVYNGLTLKDYHYFTDRSGALRRYSHPSSGSGLVETVTQPTAPSVAPLVRRRTWKNLETWAGTTPAVPTNWTLSNSAKLNLTIDIVDSEERNFSYPGGTGAVARATVANNSSKNATASRSDASFALESSAIAFWFEAASAATLLAFEYGVTGDAEFSQPLVAPATETPYLFFIDIGGLPALKYRRFRVTKNPNQSRKFWIGKIVLPGRLQGRYRWLYTHYNPTDKSESKPSPISGGGEFEDFSQIGISYVTTDTGALEKAAALLVTSDAGSDADTTRIRLYRNGGAPAYTKDQTGQDIWLLTAEFLDLSTTLDGAVSAGATTATLTAVAAGGTNLAADDWLVFQSGTDALEEVAQVSSVNTSTRVVTLKSALVYAHSNGTAVQTCYVDNNPDVVLDFTERLEIERDNPPSGAHWLAKAPNGRMWIARWANNPMGVAVSNLPTFYHPLDHEVFPDNVDPITRSSPIQGWRFNVDGDASGDWIVWAGFFRNVFTVLTSRACYQVYASSQDQWSGTVVSRQLDLGCIAGETVQEVDGQLYWATDGPRIVRWGGPGSLPEDLSFERINVRLKAAPSAYWAQWFARPHSDQGGSYYRLWYVPEGATTPTTRLDYSLRSEAWEPVVYYDSAGTARAWRTATVWNGPNDTKELYAALTAGGDAYQLETGDTDAGVAIKVRYTTGRVELGQLGDVCQPDQFYFRLAGAVDLLNVTLTLGGSEYGNQTDTHSALSVAGTGDVEVWRQTHLDKKGRWVQLAFTGDVNNRPGVRDIRVWYSTVRRGRVAPSLTVNGQLQFNNPANSGYLAAAVR